MCSACNRPKGVAQPLSDLTAPPGALPYQLTAGQSLAAGAHG